MTESNFEIIELYQGKIKVKFFTESHQYWIDGKRKRGVTSALNIKDKSTQLMSWQGEETAKFLFGIIEKGSLLAPIDVVEAIFAHEKTKNEASELGKTVHDWIEQYIKSKLKKTEMPEMPDDPNVQTGVTSFLHWESEHKVKFIWSEKVVYSKKYDYIGRADFAAKVDGLVCLCDIKTGNGMYNSVLAQTAAYAQAHREETNTKYDGRWAIRIAKETESEYIERMALKNKIKTLIGKKEKYVEPYQIFEAKFLDSEKGNMQRDFDGFLAHMELMNWDNATDFYKNK